jgi:hypothetical protein
MAFSELASSAAEATDFAIAMRRRRFRVDDFPHPDYHSATNALGELRMPRVQRDREIIKRRKRSLKIKALRERLQTERDTKTRARLIARMKKISPAAPAPER